MSPRRLIASTLLIATVCAQALAQNLPAPQPPAPGRPIHPPKPIRPRQQPCWEVAGISQATMQQVRAIRREARLQVEEVCAKSSLGLQQKRQQIRDIRQKEKLQVEGLIPPQQRESMQACQKQRGNGGGHLGTGRGTGPCGEMPGAKQRQRDSDRDD